MDSASPVDLAPWRAQLPEALQLDIAPVADHLADLPVAEQALVVAAVRSRREEFSSARHLAHHMLAREGVALQPILCDLDRSPLWPKGWLGSLTHGRKWCAAALAPMGKAVDGVGIDLEEVRPIQEDLFGEILTPSELERWTKQSSPGDLAHRALACFSIKEAVYKAMHAVGNQGLGFQAMEVLRFEPTGKVHIQAHDDLLRRLEGRALPQVLYLRQNDVHLSLAWLSSDVASAP